MDDLLHVEISLKMAKGHAGTMPTNPVISQHKEMHLPNPYRNTIREHCMQRRNQSRLCKNKDYPQLETTGESKTGQGTVGPYWILLKIY